MPHTEKTNVTEVGSVLECPLGGNVSLFSFIPRIPTMTRSSNTIAMQTIYKQGWLGTTAIGAKPLGSEELMLDGELADIEKQKEVLACNSFSDK